MEAFQNIQLSFKCPKALDELQPCQSNWYCDGCRKMVYDFRGMEEAQILQTFDQSGQKLCGIYDANRIKVLPQQPKWMRTSWTAMVAMGLMILNGCGFGEKKPKIVTTTGVLMPPEYYTTGKVKLDTPKHHHKIRQTKVKFPPPAALVGDVDVRKPNPIDTNAVFGVVEINPTYPGGEEALAHFLATHIKLKTTGEEEYVGRVFVQFNVEPGGELSDIKVIKGGTSKINEQIIEVFKQMPKWKPGVQNGRATKTSFTVPVNLNFTE